MNWSDADTLSFIKMYHERQALWDSTHGDYKNKNKRHDGLMEIADFFAIQKYDVEKKIRNVQTQFARERKREMESRQSGADADERYTSKWFAYKNMLFLAEKYKPRTTRGTQRSENEEELSESSGEQQTAATARTTRATTRGPPAVKKSKFEKTVPADKPIFIETAAVAPPRVVKDEIHVFCELLDLKLRALDEDKRDAAMHEINTMMYDLKIMTSSARSKRDGHKKRNGSSYILGSRTASSQTMSDIHISEVECEYSN